MKNLWGGTNDVSVIGYGKEQIGGENIYWAMQNVKWVKAKKTLPNGSPYHVPMKNG